MDGIRTRPVSAGERANTLADVLVRARNNGERFVVEQDGTLIADIAPRSAKTKITVGEFLERPRELGDPDEDFAEDVRAGVAAQGTVEIVAVAA